MKTIPSLLLCLLALAGQMSLTAQEIAVFTGDTTNAAASRVSNTIYTYADVPLGGRGLVEFTVKNMGTAPLTGLALSVTGQTSDFRPGILRTTSLAPQAATTFPVFFEPTAQGLRSAAFRIASNDADENPFTINLRGTGTPLQITQQPNDVVACVGGFAGFSFYAGDVASYQWERKLPGASTFVTMLGETSSSLGIFGVAATNHGTMFRARATRGPTNVLSREATLFVNVMPPPAVVYDFNAGLNGATIYGDAALASGTLALTAATGGQRGSFLTPNLAPGRSVRSFTASFKVRIIAGNGFADGFSFNWANDIPPVAYHDAEQGIGSGLSVCFDTYEGDPESLESVVSVKWNYQTVASQPLPYFVVPGEDGTFSDVFIRMNGDGTVDVTYDCFNIFTRLALPNFRPIANSQFGLGARTGAIYESHSIDDLAIAFDAVADFVDASVPGDPAVGTSTNSPAAQLSPRAIDNDATTKYLNFDKLNAGLTIAPFGRQPVRALTLISAEDAPERDPSSFVLEGSNDGTSFTRLASNAVPTFAARNAIQSFPVTNTAVFNQYRVRFPSLANAAAANSMQIAEVELLYNPEITSTNDVLSLTLPPGATDVRGVGALFDQQLALTRKFEVWNLTNNNTVVYVTPAAGLTMLKGWELIGAADDFNYPQRRPSSVTVAGSKDGANYTHLATVNPAAPTANLQIQEFLTAAPLETFTRYRITFGPPVSGTILQVGEIRLFGSAVAIIPEIAVYTGDTTNAGAALISGGGYVYPNTGTGEVRTATFTIQNLGVTNLSALALSKTGPAANEFILSPLSSTNLAPDASVTFTVVFAPTAVGVRSASIWIASDDADENPFEIKLSGIGRNNNTFAEASIPGDPATPTTFNSPFSEGADKAIDNNVTTKYLNLDKLNTGLTVTPAGRQPVRALTLISAEDAPERDPSSFVLEGSTNGINYTRVASNAVPAFAARNAIQSFPLTNLTAFNQYRLRFPTVANAAAANSMQISEIELLYWPEISSPNDAVSITLPPGAVDVRGVTNLFDRQLSITRKFEVAPITNANTVVKMTPVAGTTILKGFELIGATDDFSNPGRRPSSVTVAGSMDGINYTDITTVVPPVPLSNLQIQEYSTSTNALAFAHYRITFGPPVSGDRLQVGEVRLFGVRTAPEIVVYAGNTTNPTASRTNGGTYVFQDTAIGGGRTATFTIQNLGEVNLTGLALNLTGPGVANYSVSVLTSTNLAPNEVATFSMNFGPAAATNYGVSVWITSNDPDESPFEIKVSGTGRTNVAFAEVSVPGDPVIATSANSPAGQGADKAIDNNVATKYLNLNKLNTGLTITPLGDRPVRALTLMSAEDFPDRDPSSFVLEGSYDGVSFTRIASNAVPAFPARNSIQSFAFENNNVFTQYRVLFPTVSNAATANSMQVAEVELLVWPEISSPNDAMSITLPPDAVDVRGVGKLFDRQLGTTNKLEVAQSTNTSTVVEITPSAGVTVLKSFEVIGATDDFVVPGRRPSSVTVAGSMDGINYTALATVVPAAPSFNLQIQEFSTAQNALAFARYRITFGPPVSGDRLQVGELRLFGELAEIPPSLTIQAGNGNVVLSWAHSPGYVLESKGAFSSTSWNIVGTTPVLSNGTNTVTLPVAGDAAFFRLRK